MRILGSLALLGLSAALIFAGVKVFGMTSSGYVAMFYVVWLWGILPIPIPVGIFREPHFWAVILFLAGSASLVFAVLNLRRR